MAVQLLAPLHNAAHTGNNVAVRLLTAAGAAIDIRDWVGDQRTAKLIFRTDCVN